MPQVDASSQRARRVQLGLIMLLALLEAALLVARFSARALRDADDPWMHLAYQAYYLSFLGISAITAVLAFGRPALRRMLREGEVLLAAHRHRAAFVVAQLACFAVLYALTRAVFEAPAAADGVATAPSAVRVAAWIAAGLASALCWLLCLVPPRALREAAALVPRSLLGVLAIGLVAGAAGFAVRTWLWRPLGAGTLVLARAMAAPFCPEVTVDPAAFVIGTSTFSVDIVPECSGYEGIGLVWVFVGSYLWLFRERLRFPRALWMLPLATVAVWLANAARIAALVLLGHYVSPDMAEGGFHSKSGWILFCAVALAGVEASRRVAGVSREDDRSRALSGTTVAFLLPLLALVGTGMLMGLFAGPVDELYGLRLLAAGGALYACRRAYPRWSPDVPWVALLLGMALALPWALLTHDPERDRVLADGLAASAPGVVALWWTTRWLGSALVVPVVEELAFRGYLTRRLVASDVDDVPLGRLTASSWVLSSVAFGLVHHELVAGTVAGLVYAVALARRRRLWDAFAAHAATNATLGLYALATGRLSVWM